MKENEYQCALCKGVFEKGQTDEEALKEAEEYWGTLPVEEMELVCDDCWEKCRPENNRELYEGWQQAKRELNAINEDTPGWET